MGGLPGFLRFSHLNFLKSHDPSSAMGGTLSCHVSLSATPVTRLFSYVLQYPPCRTRPSGVGRNEKPLRALQGREMDGRVRRREEARLETEEDEGGRTGACARQR